MGARRPGKVMSAASGRLTSEAAMMMSGVFMMGVQANVEKAGRRPSAHFVMIAPMGASVKPEKRHDWRARSTLAAAKSIEIEPGMGQRYEF